MIEKLESLDCEFTQVDISSKPEYVEGMDLKFPYLFLSGVAACGMEGLESIADQLPKQMKKMTVIERIQDLLKKETILFMKGSPDSPQCGFSSRICAILKQYDGLKFDHFNIFEDNELREALKKYSNWPTYPQLYHKGKLIGGIDIVQELHEEKELEDALGIN